MWQRINDNPRMFIVSKFRQQLCKTRSYISARTIHNTSRDIRFFAFPCFCNISHRLLTMFELSWFRLLTLFFRTSSDVKHFTSKQSWKFTISKWRLRENFPVDRFVFQFLLQLNNDFFRVKNAKILGSPTSFRWKTTLILKKLAHEIRHGLQGFVVKTI